MSVQWEAIKGNFSDVSQTLDKLNLAWSDHLQPTRVDLEKLANIMQDLQVHVANMMYNTVALIGHHTGYEKRKAEEASAPKSDKKTQSLEEQLFELIRTKRVVLKTEVYGAQCNNLFSDLKLVITGLEVGDKGMESNR